MRPRARNHPRQGWGEAGTRRPDASLVLPVARMDPPSPHEISPLGESYGNLIFIVNVFVSLSPSIIEFHMLQVHEQGKSVLVRESMEKAEHYVHQLQRYSLHATMERDE